MIKVAIVDDEADCAERLKGYIEQYSTQKSVPVQIFCYKDGIDFLSELRRAFDIVFFDIAMPRMDGMEAAKQLREFDKNVGIIFITDLAQYAISGYDVGAQAFLVKPVKQQDFVSRMDKAVACCESNKGPYISLFTLEKAHIKVYLRDISYVEGDNHNIIYHVNGESIRVRGTMRDVISRLDGNRLFAQCDRSFILNLAHVDKIRKNEVIVDGACFPISRSRKKSFLDAVTVYWGMGGV